MNQRGKNKHLHYCKHYFIKCILNMKTLELSGIIKDKVSAGIGKILNTLTFASYSFRMQRTGTVYDILSLIFTKSFIGLCINHLATGISFRKV